MIKGNFKTENQEKEDQEIIFPEESGLIIERILEKYNLKEKQKIGIERFIESKILEEKKEIFENLPGSKIAKLVKEYAEGKVLLAEIPFRLSQELNIPEKKAEEIAQDLENSLLILITPHKGTTKKSFKTIGEVIFKP